MPRTIKLTTNFLRRESGFGDFQIPHGLRTLGDLLRHIGRQADFIFTDAEGVQLRPDIEVMINEKNMAFYPTGLKTSVKDGDWVDISLTPMGGG